MAGEAAGSEHPAPAQPAPVSPGQRPTAGDARVDAALARLDELPDLPVTEHPSVFDDVHRRLEEVLDELDADRLTNVGQAGADQASADDHSADDHSADDDSADEDSAADDSADDDSADEGRGAVPGPGR